MQQVHIQRGTVIRIVDVNRGDGWWRRGGDVVHGEDVDVGEGRI